MIPLCFPVWLGDKAWMSAMSLELHEWDIHIE